MRHTAPHPFPGASAPPRTILQRAPCLVMAAAMDSSTHSGTTGSHVPFPVCLPPEHSRLNTLSHGCVARLGHRLRSTCFADMQNLDSPRPKGASRSSQWLVARLPARVRCHAYARLHYRTAHKIRARAPACDFGLEKTAAASSLARGSCRLQTGRPPHRARCDGLHVGTLQASIVLQCWQTTAPRSFHSRYKTLICVKHACSLLPDTNSKLPAC